MLSSNNPTGRYIRSVWCESWTVQEMKLGNGSGWMATCCFPDHKWCLCPRSHLEKNLCVWSYKSFSIITKYIIEFLIGIIVICQIWQRWDNSQNYQTNWAPRKLAMMIRYHGLSLDNLNAYEELGLLCFHTPLFIAWFLGYSTVSQLFLLFHSNFPGTPDQENLSENINKRTENFRDILCLEIRFFKPFNLLIMPRKTFTSKIPYILIQNRLCLPDHHSAEIYTSPLFAWASARAAFCTDISIQPCQAIQHSHALKGST